MKICSFILMVFLSISFGYATEKVDCNDPKNLPRDIGGVLMGGKKSVLLIVAQQSVLNVVLI